MILATIGVGRILENFDDSFGGKRMKQNSGERYYVFFSLVQIALLIISFILNYLTLFSEIEDFNRVGLGSTLRDWYWYETFLFVLTYITPVLILVNAMGLYVKMKRKFRLTVGVCVFLALAASAVILNYSVLAGALLAYIAGILVCVCCIFRRKKIVRNS